MRNLTKLKEKDKEKDSKGREREKAPTQSPVLIQSEHPTACFVGIQAQQWLCANPVNLAVRIYS